MYPHNLFLRKWVFAPNCHCSIAVDTHGDVLGYGVIRTTLGEENERRIGPVFAENSDIAITISKDLCVKVAACDAHAGISVDVSHGKNFSPKYFTLFQECQAKPTLILCHICTSDAPSDMPFHSLCDYMNYYQCTAPICLC